MTFDLSTAQPVEQAQNVFDINTARPVDETDVDVPRGTDGDFVPTFEQLPVPVGKEKKTMAALVNEKMPAKSASEQAKALRKGVGRPVYNPSFLDYLEEPAFSIGANTAGMVVSGIEGLAIAPFKGSQAASEAIESTQKSIAESTAPKTERGHKAMETIGDLVDAGIDIARVPLGGIASLGELLMGQGKEQAIETMRSVEAVGYSDTVGKRVLDETNSPFLATGAAIAPEIVGSVLPIARMANNRSAFNTQMAKKIYAGGTDNELAKYIITGSGQLAKDPLHKPLVNKGFDPGVLAGIKGSIMGDVARLPAPETPHRLNAPIITAKGVDDAVETASQFDAVKAAKIVEDAARNRTTITPEITAQLTTNQSKLLLMLEIKKKGMKNTLWGTTNRAGDVAGDSLMQRVNHIRTVNENASKRVSEEAKKLKGQQVDSSDPINQFVDDLDEMGIDFGDSGALVYDNSILRGKTLGKARGVLDDVVDFLRTSSKTGVMPDANDLHQAKIYIDEIVTYGKSDSGITGKTELVLKKLRRNIDQVLDNNFPAYNEANTVYSETIGVLDALQDVAGRKMNLTGGNADKAVGTLLRRMTSNAQSRVNLIDAVDMIEETAKKYGGAFNDNLKLQVTFANELDRVFGASASTSLMGDVTKATQTAIESTLGNKSTLGKVKDVAKTGMNKMLNTEDAKAFDMLQEMIERTPDPWR